tara:strand:+ start:4964 stop:5548 length:585 start_codon:yes stop_codon:yes gene_type:complete
MKFTIRDVDTRNDEEVNLVVSRTMETVLETIPEFEGNAEIALSVFSNFTHEQMKAMIQKDFDNPNHRILVAEKDSTNEVVAHAIFSIKEDADGKKFGFCFSRFVKISERRNGIADSLLKLQEKWWVERGAGYVLAHTHVCNLKLQKLFKKNGYEKEGPINGGHYSYLKLSKTLPLSKNSNDGTHLDFENRLLKL